MARTAIDLPILVKGIVVDTETELQDSGSMVECKGFVEFEGMLIKDYTAVSSGIILDVIRNRNDTNLAQCSQFNTEQKESGSGGTNGEVEGGSGGGW